MGTVLNQGRIRQCNERDGLQLRYAVPKIQLASNPHCPFAARLWEIFTFNNPKICGHNTCAELL